MSRPKNPRVYVLRVPGVELLRICHLGAASNDRRVQNAADSIFSLLALSLQQEIVNIPDEMDVYYKVLAAQG